MPAPLSNDLRQRIIKSIFEEGLSCNAAAKRYGVAASTTIRLKNHFLLHKTYKPLKLGGSKPYKLSKFDNLFRDLIATTPDSTLEEICCFMESKGLVLSTTSVFRYLSHIGYSLKKRRFMLLNKNEKTYNTEEFNGRNIKEE